MLSEEDFKTTVATAIRKMRNAEKKSCEELAAHSDIDYSSLNSDLLMIGSIQAAGGVMDTLIRFFEENIKIH